MEYSNENKGIISKNERKEKDTHPDIKGSINVGGVDYWLDGWLKKRNDGTGSFYSLSVKPKEQKESHPVPKNADQFKARQLAPKGGFEDMDSDIPF